MLLKLNRTIFPNIVKTDRTMGRVACPTLLPPMPQDLQFSNKTCRLTEVEVSYDASPSIPVFGHALHFNHRYYRFAGRGCYLAIAGVRLPLCLVVGTRHEPGETRERECKCGTHITLVQNGINPELPLLRYLSHLAALSTYNYKVSDTIRSTTGLQLDGSKKENSGVNSS